MKTSSQPFPFCFSDDFTAAKWKRQPVRGRDVMTFSWMMLTKSKKQQYAECQRGDIWFPFRSCGITTGTPADITVLPRLALGLSDFSFHFNVFRNNTHITTPCNTTAASWYFDYLHKVWLNKGDSVSVTFSISWWRQTGKRSQSSAHRTWGDCQSGGCLKLFWGYSNADLDGWLRHRHTNRSRRQQGLLPDFRATASLENSRNPNSEPNIHYCDWLINTHR